MAALDAFGFASLGLTAPDFERPDQVIQLGVSPVGIDLITSITGVSWDEAFAGRMPSTYGDIPVHYIGRDQFLVNKRATGRSETLRISKPSGKSKSVSGMRSAYDEEILNSYTGIG